jgi:hypothetical protein
MLLGRGQFAFLAAVLVGAYGVDLGLNALMALTVTYYATRWVLIDSMRAVGNQRIFGINERTNERTCRTNRNATRESLF